MAEPWDKWEQELRMAHDYIHSARTVLLDHDAREATRAVSATIRTLGYLIDEMVKHICDQEPPQPG